MISLVHLRRLIESFQSGSFESKSPPKAFFQIEQRTFQASRCATEKVRNENNRSGEGNTYTTYEGSIPRHAFAPLLITAIDPESRHLHLSPLDASQDENLACRRLKEMARISMRTILSSTCEKRGMSERSAS